MRTTVHVPVPDKDGVNTPEGWIEHGFAANTDLVGMTQVGSGTTAIRTNRGYDNLGRLTEIGTTVGYPEVLPSPFARTSYSYNAAGQRIKATRGDNTWWDYDYNNRNEVRKGRKKWSDGTQVDGMQFGSANQDGYTYDAIGNRNGTLLNNRIGSRGYNSNNQVTSGSTQPAVDVVGEADPSKYVSVDGSLASRKGTYFAGQATGPVNYSYPLWKFAYVDEWIGETHKLQGGNVLIPPYTPSYTYDADGNQTADDRWIYIWDAENRLAAAETRWTQAQVPNLPQLKLTFKYDAYWRRTEKKLWEKDSNGVYQPKKLTKFAYDGWNLIAEWEQTWTNNVASALQLVRTHHWGMDLSGTLQGGGGVGGLVLTRHHQPSGQTASYVPAYDGTGNVMALIDTVTGQRAAEYEYGPFGEPLRVSGFGSVAKDNPIRWSTKHLDSETGLLNYGLRLYDCGKGRWASRDPIQESGGRNLYQMVSNNPLEYYDVLGAADSREWPRFKSCADLDSFNVDQLKENLRKLGTDFGNAKDKWKESSKPRIDGDYRNPKYNDPLFPKKWEDDHLKSANGYRQLGIDGCAKAKALMKLVEECCGPHTPERQAVFETLKSTIDRYCNDPPPPYQRRAMSPNRGPVPAPGSMKLPPPYRANQTPRPPYQPPNDDLSDRMLLGGAMAGILWAIETFGPYLWPVVVP